MKILQLIHTFSQLYGGGLGEVVRQLSKALVQRGHEVVIYTSDFELNQEYIDSLLGIKVCAFHSWSSWAGLHLTLGMPARLKGEIRNFDIIHLHGYRSLQDVVVHHYARKYGIPYILQAHGSVVTFFQKGSLKRVFDKVWGYKILKDASKLIAVTPIEVEQYKSMDVSEDKIEIVPNGIDLSEFESLPERGGFRRNYGLDGNQKIILYLGRIHKFKGLDHLAKAFAGLSTELDDVKLVIAGPDDGYLPTLIHLIKELEIEEEVVFTGPLYGQEKLKAYVDAAVYVLPSFYEIFGITVLEALACGTPVIVTDRCGIADVIDGQAGLVVPYEKEQLQQALLHMLDDDKMRQQFGEKGKLLVGEKFDWEKIAERVESIYKDIL